MVKKVWKKNPRKSKNIPRTKSQQEVCERLVKQLIDCPRLYPDDYTAQELLDEAISEEYTYFRMYCSRCGMPIAVTNHKKQIGDLTCAGDTIPTKWFKGTCKDGEVIGCLNCHNNHVESEPITDEEYKKIRETIC